jgi:hypothetical protein
MDKHGKKKSCICQLFLTTLKALGAQRKLSTLPGEGRAGTKTD